MFHILAGIYHDINQERNHVPGKKNMNF